MSTKVQNEIETMLSRKIDSLKLT